MVQRVGETAVADAAGVTVFLLSQERVIEVAPV
jgi:hypothetical protein